MPKKYSTHLLVISIFLISITVVNNGAQGNNTDQPPYLSSTSLTFSVQENLDIGTKVGNPLEGTDPEGLTVTYSRTFGIGGYSYFAIDQTTGQLSTLQVLDYETQTSHTIQVTVNDPGGNSNSYTITINVINDTSDDNSTNRPPEFIEGDSATRNIIVSDDAEFPYLGSPILATDPDGGTLYYVITEDLSGFFYLGSHGTEIVGGVPITVRHEIPQVKYQLPPIFRSVGDTYTIKLTVWDDQNASNSIQITINVVAENSPPGFLEGSSATRSIKENTDASIDIGAPIFAIDVDDPTITYSLSGTDASSFSINTNTGQLQTLAALDYETKNTYIVTVNVSDDNDVSDSITVTINIIDVDEVVPNNPPVFTDGTSTTRSITENSASGTNIGSPVTATDPDSGDKLTFSLSGPDAASFSIVSNSGQLQTVAPLDYETKFTYTVTVNVFDGNGGSNSISVTINVTDVNETVTFPPIQQPQPQSQTNPQPQQSQPDPQPESNPLPQPEPNYTIIPFDYEKEDVGRIVFSEIMLSQRNKDVQREDLPQWIELYNTTDQDIDINGWKIVERYLDDSNTMNILESQVISKALTIKSKETVLIVSYATPNSRDRISTGLADKTYALGSNSKNFWNYEGIVLELQDTEGNPIDRIGNLNENNEIIFEIPPAVRNERVSLIRRLKSIRTEKYNFTFGMKEFGWFPANEAKRLTSGRSKYYYGRYTDIGSPGYRTEAGEILPVTLSSFIPQLNQDGSVVKNWVTESEVNNAGFNILRSEKPQGPFSKINPKLVQGAGTTSEQHKYVWTDNSAKPNVQYYYRIEDVSFAGVKQMLSTQRVKGIHTANNRHLTKWATIKNIESGSYIIGADRSYD